MNCELTLGRGSSGAGGLANRTASRQLAAAGVSGYNGSLVGVVLVFKTMTSTLETPGFLSGDGPISLGSRGECPVTGWHELRMAGGLVQQVTPSHSRENADPLLFPRPTLHGYDPFPTHHAGRSSVLKDVNCCE